MRNANLHVSNEVDDLLNFQLSQSAIGARARAFACLCYSNFAFSQSVIDASDL